MKYKIALIFICFFSLGCKKEIVTEYRESPVQWNQHSEIESLEKYIINGSVINEELYLIGRNIFTRIDTSNNTFSSIWQGYDYQNIKIPMSDILMLTSERENVEGQIEFVYIPGLIQDGYTKAKDFIKFRDIDTSFLKFDHFQAYQNIDFGSFNDDHQVLVPYLGNPNHFSFMLISFNINTTPNTSLASDNQYIKIEGSKIISIPKKNESNAIPFTIHSIGQDYIISNSEITAKIYSDGTFKVIDSNQFLPKRFFEFGGTLYAVSYSKIYSSTDSGENWQIAYQTNGSSETFMYSVIDNRIILSKGSSILELTFDDDGFKTVELENDALEGNYITSIDALHNTVYISTLSGLFYRNLSDFFNPKTIIE